MSGIPGVNSGGDYLYLGNADTSLGVVLGVNLGSPLSPVPLRVINGAAPPFNVLVNGLPILTFPLGPAPQGSTFISNGVAFVTNTITGTLNEVIVTNGPGTITLSTPQPLATSSNVFFNSVTIAGAPAVNTVSISSTVAADPGSAFVHTWQATCVKHKDTVTVQLTDLSVTSSIANANAFEAITGLIPAVPAGMRPPSPISVSGWCTYNATPVLMNISVSPLGNVIIGIAAPSGTVVVSNWGVSLNPFQGLVNNFTYKV